MLQSHTGKTDKLKAYGWIVGVEAHESVDPNTVTQKLADALAWVEGIGTVDVEYLGEIETLDGDESKES